MLWRTMPSRFALCVAVTLWSSLALPCARAQPSARPLLQLEVADSIGLPLPDATLEVYTAVERGIFREWIAVEPSELPPGNWLLRISHPGYRTSIQSVPLQKDKPFALRVRLGAPRDSASRTGPVIAEQVRALGMPVSERTADVMVGRRVIDRRALDRAGAKTLLQVIKNAKELNMMMVFGSGGTYTVGGGWEGAKGCPLREIVNGKKQGSTSIANLDNTRELDDVEAIEVLPRQTGDLYVHDDDSGYYCGMVIVWLKDP
jgi:hypothetical protein